MESLPFFSIRMPSCCTERTLEGLTCGLASKHAASSKLEPLLNPHPGLILSSVLRTKLVDSSVALCEDRKARMHNRRDVV